MTATARFILFLAALGGPATALANPSDTETKTTLIVLTDGQVKYLGGERSNIQSRLADLGSGDVAVRPIALDLFGFTIRRQLEYVHVLAALAPRPLYVDMGDFVDLACQKEMDLYLEQREVFPDLISPGNHDMNFAGNLRKSTNALGAIGIFNGLQNLRVHLWGPACGVASPENKKKDRKREAEAAILEKDDFITRLNGARDEDRPVKDRPETRCKGDGNSNREAGRREWVTETLGINGWTVHMVDSSDQTEAKYIPGLPGLNGWMSKAQADKRPHGDGPTLLFSHFPMDDWTKRSRRRWAVNTGDHWIYGHAHWYVEAAGKATVAPSVLDAYQDHKGADENTAGCPTDDQCWLPGGLKVTLNDADDAPVIERFEAKPFGSDIEPFVGTLAAYPLAVRERRATRASKSSSNASAIKAYAHRHRVRRYDARPIMVYQFDRMIAYFDAISELDSSPWIAEFGAAATRRARSWARSANPTDMDLFHFGCTLDGGFTDDCVYSAQMGLRSIKRDTEAFKFMHDLALQAALEEADDERKGLTMKRP